jgi:hypothetical protein
LTVVATDRPSEQSLYGSLVGNVTVIIDFIADNFLVRSIVAIDPRELDEKQFENTLTVSMCPGGDCFVKILYVRAPLTRKRNAVDNIQRTIVTFYAVNVLDGSPRTSNALNLITAVEVVERFANPAVQTSLQTTDIGARIIEVKVSSETKSETKKSSSEDDDSLLAVYIAAPLGFILVLVLIVLALRSNERERLVDHRVAGSTMFMPSSLNQAINNQDALSALYANEDAFGQQFQNPLRSSAWWDDGPPSMEDGFLASATVGMGMNAMSPIQQAPDIFDSSAIDPASGRTYLFDSQTGNRVWADEDYLEM